MPYRIRGATVAAVLAMAWTQQRRLIYFPFGRLPDPNGRFGVTGLTAVRFPTADGLTLNGWFVKPARDSRDFTVIVFNGNAGNRSFRAGRWPMRSRGAAWQFCCSTIAASAETRAHRAEAGPQARCARGARLFLGPPGCRSRSDRLLRRVAGYGRRDRAGRRRIRRRR